jgi:hypothetical protein
MRQLDDAGDGVAKWRATIGGGCHAHATTAPKFEIARVAKLAVCRQHGVSIDPHGLGQFDGRGQAIARAKLALSDRSTDASDELLLKRDWSRWIDLPQHGADDTSTKNGLFLQK